jgi:hypothetical protein
MSEQHEEQAKSEEKVYPGNLARYVEMREVRSSMDVSDPNFFAAVIAEELTGLAYILDGIRYSARQNQR